MESLDGCPKISVEGYNTCLPVDDIRNALFKHFSSCGEISAVVIPRDPVTDAIGRCAYICFLPEYKMAPVNALALNGSDVGGWNVMVKPSWRMLYPGASSFPEEAPRRRNLYPDPLPRLCFFSVSGYDTSLRVEEVKSALFKHFSSCGEVINVFIEPQGFDSCPYKLDSSGYIIPVGSTIPVQGPNQLLKSSCAVAILGEAALDKALALSGTDVGGWKVIAEPMPERTDDPGRFKFPLGICLHGPSPYICPPQHRPKYRGPPPPCPPGYNVVHAPALNYVHNKMAPVNALEASSFQEEAPTQRKLYPNPLPPLCFFSVSGYDTSLGAEEVKSALFKHFSSCGEVINVYIEPEGYDSRPYKLDPSGYLIHTGFTFPVQGPNQRLKSSGVVGILGEAAVDKALALSGTDVGGWKVIAKPMPEPTRHPPGYVKLPIGIGRPGSRPYTCPSPFKPK